MRAPLAALAIGAAACGGGKPAPDFGHAVSPKPTTRVAVEDEPDDGIEVMSTVGHVDPAVVTAALAPHRTALVSCYTERVGRRSWLGGHAMLRWVIAADGTVTRVVIVESDLGAWPIEKCMLDIAREISFGAPTGGPAELTLPLTFDAPANPETLDLIASAKAVGGELDSLATCSGGAPSPNERDPRVGGKVIARRGAKPKAKPPKPAVPTVRSRAPSEVSITLYLHGSGRVESVGFASATGTLEDAWATCAEQVALSWAINDAPRIDPRDRKGQVVKLGVRYRPR